MTVEPRNKPWAGLIVGVGLLVLMVGSCLVLFVLPNILGRNFRPKKRSSEARINLKAAFTAEKANFGEFDTYDERIEKIGFTPERKNRYRYLFSKTDDALTQGSADGGMHTGVLSDDGVSKDAVLLAGIPVALLKEVGLEGSCPSACNITLIAVGNIDDDATIDVWSISTKDRKILGESVPAGTPYNDVNDTEK
jgi:type IV pilus assembly protein PilA